MPPLYHYLDPGDWSTRIDSARALAAQCRLCPRACGVARMDGEIGFCGATNRIGVSSAFAHHGEEPPISGSGGSGTVFFSHCTLKCLFCQNHQISHEGQGALHDPAGLAALFLDLERQGCHNINLVTAGHYLPWWLDALRIAADQGLQLPIVYNCGGYETPEALELLNGVIDIYLPDMKYGDPEAAQEFSAAPDYVTVNKQAIRTMFAQSGPLKLDSAGISRRGLIIRHLVLPGDLSHSHAIARWLSETFDPEDITISLMAQYRPLYRAMEDPRLSSRVEPDLYLQIRDHFIQLGFNGFYQEPERLNSAYIIDFTQRTTQRLIDADDLVAPGN